MQAGRIDVRDTTWTLGVDETDTPAEAGTWLYAGPDHTITLDQVTFQTAGVPWILANADQVRALGLDACAAGGPGSGATPLFGTSDEVAVWNSALVMADAETPLVTGDGWVGLRGVTVVTGNTGGNLAERSDTLEASNTLFVGATASADAALPDRSGGWPAHVVRAEAAADIFSSPADVFDCRAKPKPDAGIEQVQDLGVKAESNADGTLTNGLGAAANELGELPGAASRASLWTGATRTERRARGRISGPSADPFGEHLRPGCGARPLVYGRGWVGCRHGGPGCRHGGRPRRRDLRLCLGRDLRVRWIDGGGGRAAAARAVLAAAPAGVGPRPG